MQTILVPLDGSSSSRHSVNHVVREFKKNPSLEVHILNVQSPFSKNVSRHSSPRSRSDFHLEQSGKALASARQALDSAGIDYSVHTDVGDKAACISHAVSRLHCDHIVMGTARKSSLLRLVENSVTNQVIARATVPVEVIAGDSVPLLERVGLPAGLGAGVLTLALAVE